ncbi:polyprenyl synthetase [Aspergillus ellipticus CBS 707.79]|uniref:Polyprenyl synthetase n=1 Tax=Aspergillus ellipticus CBS 707.79 TaxID=1448320 RepID=A0A319EBH6_9EURO|nr:polyprenyl synthetase [Aspergillus ellipticus CBS 707.79]
MGWASGVELTPEEKVETGPITYLAFVVLAITNDVWSWEKERQITVDTDGSQPLINAVGMVMRMHQTDEETATKVVHEIIQTHEEQYCQLRDEYLANNRVSASVKKWFQVLELSIAGNALWSIGALRYHPHAKNPYEGPFDIEPVFGGGEVGQRGEGGGRFSFCELDGAGLTVADYRDCPPNGALGPGDDVIWKPYEYIASMQSKNVRQTLALAMQVWYQVPHRSLMIISAVGGLMHEASLMLDDIQDGSALRRGKPAVHEVFGVGQTINTACFQMNNALKLAQQLSPAAVAILAELTCPEQLDKMYTGQGTDIHWTNHKMVPSEEGYLMMIDGKTGGLFGVIYRLMRSEATVNQDLNLDRLIVELGRLFQIRDDYHNLASQDYMTQRGFCQDLDEGKLSLPLIYTCQTLGEKNSIITELLHMRDRRNGLSLEAKQVILSQTEECGGLEYTETRMNSLFGALRNTLEQVEGVTGQRNWMLRSMVLQLGVGGKSEGEKGKGKKGESTWESVLRVWGGYREAAWREKGN